MTGPTLNIIPDAQWEDELAKEDISAWYHTPKKGLAILAPGAFSRPDNLAGPSDGDRITSRQTEWDQAARAAHAMMGGIKPVAADMVGFKVIEHEFSHCMLPAPFEGTQVVNGINITFELAQQRWSHPDQAVPAIGHAFTVGFQVNAFTRLLRWYTTPEEVRSAFLRWMDAQTAARAAGV